MTTKKKARQGQIALQTTIGIASVLIGAGIAGQASPVQAASQQSSQALTALAAEKAVNTSDTQVLGQARGQENVSDDTAGLNQTAATSSQVSAADSGANSQIQASDQANIQKPAVQENANFDGQSIIYGDKSKIAPENLETKVFELYDTDTNEVLERHTFYVDKTNNESFTYLNEFVKWYYNSGFGNLRCMGYRSPDNPDDPYNFPGLNLARLTNEGDQSIRLGVKRTDTKPILSSYNFYQVVFNKVSNDNNLDPAIFIGNLGALPDNTQVSWETAPQWENDDDAVPPLLNLDQVAIRVEIPGQKLVIIRANDPASENSLTLADLLKSLRPNFDDARMQNTITVPLGELPDASTFFHPSDEKGKLYHPFWLLKPNIGRAGYSVGWVSLYVPGAGLESNIMLVLVRTLPRAADQKIVYQDASTGQPLSDTLLSGQITDLYQRTNKFSADQLKAAIDRHVPAGYRIADGYRYPETIFLSDNLPQLLVPLVLTAKPYQPGDLSQPVQPDQPSEPAKPADSATVVASDQTIQLKASRQEAASLPQTGNQPGVVSVLTLGLSALLSALGLSAKKKGN